MTQEDIICAISTSPGRGAIAVIRVSGKGCIELCDSIFFSPSGKILILFPIRENIKRGFPKYGAFWTNPGKG